MYSMVSVKGIYLLFCRKILKPSIFICIQAFRQITFLFLTSSINFLNENVGVAIYHFKSLLNIFSYITKKILYKIIDFLTQIINYFCNVLIIDIQK